MQTINSRQGMVSAMQNTYLGHGRTIALEGTNFTLTMPPFARRKDLKTILQRVEKSARRLWEPRT